MNGKRKDSVEEETGGGIHRIRGEKYRSNTINKEKTSNISAAKAAVGFIRNCVKSTQKMRNAW
jgi:hypothetical protein